ncbi:hypothetical protein KP509_36G027600 [Ceratopteris richardii]|uniref:Helicase MAGATAMA 3 n=1 Tax=Ceratopteris richardii TaxID=49495 RepID=A0A8T2QC33_CERRI|nr:hypothetical protein KP509_36G027600 [Ceratopteris richardii]
MVAMGGSAAIASNLQNRLQKMVLSWDYLRLLSEMKVSTKKKKKDSGSVLREVPLSFSDVKEYLSVFEPLLFEEVKAQICRGEEEGGSFEWEMIAVIKCEKAHDFHFAQVAVQAHMMEQLSDNDLIIVSKEKFQDGSTIPSAYAFASVEGREGKQTLKLRLFLEGEFTGLNEKTLSRSSRLLKMAKALQTANTAWWMMKVSNLSTIIREYTALQSVNHLPFADVILSGQDKIKINDSSDSIIPPKLMGFLLENHNESQIQAIKAGLAHTPMVLIQGPPGTGKTQTILGLLSVALHAVPSQLPSKSGGQRLYVREDFPVEKKFDHWLKASPWLGKAGNPRDMLMPCDGDDGFFPTTNNDFKLEVVSAKRKHRVHVLVCAPSNSALDEIVLRLMNTGLRDENGQAFIPSIVRIGVNPHHSVQSVSMDYLVEQRLSSMDRGIATSGPRAGSAGMERERMRLSIMNEAAIVCSTLSFSGSGVFHRMNRGFDVVIIDEAAQAVEPSTLVPLAHGCKQVFLVGDPLQLPATVLSTVAIQHGYSMSLFKRFQKAGYPVHMLKTQYRMHPQIREFPSEEFYDEALIDGSSVEAQTNRPWHIHRCFGPFSFFDIDGEETQPVGSGSWVNNEEVEFVLVLYRHLIARFPELKGGSDVAVISPYKQQVKLFRQRFRDLLGTEGAHAVDVNTVDGFQGREKDVAIFSCVRANSGKGIGFLSDFRRMNVGLTRARSSMLVVGSASTLMQDKHWGNLVKSAQRRKRIFKVSKPYHNLFTDESFAAMKKIDMEEIDEQKCSAEERAMMSEAPEHRMDDSHEYSDDELVEAVENFGEVKEDEED